MARNGTDLTSKQEAAIAALLSSRNVDEAAQTAHVPARTLWRWMKDPAFDKAYRAARRAAFGQAVARLQQASGAAATVLLKVVVDQNTPAATRVRAAEIVLDRAAKAIELEDVEARVTELERAAEASKKGL